MGQNEIETVLRMRGLLELLAPHIAVLWKDWPMALTLTMLNPQQGQFSLSGICPHCNHGSVFIAIAGPVNDAISSGWQGYGSGYRFFAVMQCQGCRECILGVAFRPGNSSTLYYVVHYPLGKRRLYERRP